jgi:predicted nucleic acid-binding protein
MPSIPTGRRVFLDTNVLLYAVTEHPGYGKWADVLPDRIRNNRVEGVISVIVLNELLHQLAIGEVSQREELHPSLVTNDRDFNRVVGIKVWRPASE